ncbi:MAG TPA: SRPBCC family protein [Nitrososphaerales archaeon]|nr:SRPBCC family protein [Nitrososphaerales archaeon]
MIIEASIVVNRPAEDVWKFMIDLVNTPKWDPGVLEVKQTSAGPIGVGTTLQSRHPKNRVLNARALEYEPNRKFTLEFTSGPIKGTRVSYVLENIEGKNTKLTRT